MSREIMHLLLGFGSGFGGIEQWLLHLFQQSPYIREESSICLVGKSAENQLHTPFAQEIAALGIPIHSFPFTSSSFGVNYFLRLVRFLKAQQPTVLHSHLGYRSGPFMVAGLLARIPHRITHYHAQKPKPATFARSIQVYTALKLANLVSSHFIGASSSALTSYYGPRWDIDARKRVLYCGIDLEPFSRNLNTAMIRSQLGISPEVFTILHVGRFTPEKNHRFMIDVVEIVVRDKQDIVLLLIGEGPLLQEMREYVKLKNLNDQVLFVGNVKDVARLLIGVADLFLFPSTSEALGLALVEAQAAGIPSIISTAIPDEAVVSESLVKKMPLSKLAWAEEIMVQYSRGSCAGRILPPDNSLEIVRRSQFNIIRSTHLLEQLYHDISR